MKKINKLISALSAISATSIALAPALAGCSSSKPLSEYHILSVNDVHGAMAGYGEDVVDVSSKNPGCLRLAREMNKIKSKYPDTLLVSAGDENSGDCWSVCDHGKTTYPILSSMGIRYASVGNHAFEWGLDDMASGNYDRLGRTDKTEGKYFVASNILNTNEYQTKEWCTDPTKQEFIADFATWMNQKVAWADPYKIVNFGPAKVCLIGLTTQNTLIDGNKKVTSQFSFIDYTTAIHYTKYLAHQELGDDEYNKIDSFILLTHCDSDYTNKILTGESVKLAGIIDTDIDAIISAHSHKVGCGRIWNNRLNKPIWVGQAGTACQYFLDTKLTVDRKAKAGQRITDVSMTVNQVPIPDTKEAAQQEWWDLEVCEDPDLAPVVNQYAIQKAIVNEKVTEILSYSNLDTTANETQNNKAGEPFDGYYNGILESGKKIGHEYYDCTAILDHLSAWACRAMMLGYSIENWEEIVKGNLLIPSAGFLSQDSLPADVKNGPIRFKNMFALQPYDNYVKIAYLSIFQLANVINYSLAGNPEQAQKYGGKGFSYTDKNTYAPDLNYYNAAKDDGELFTIQTAYNLSDDNGKPLTQSGYVCGILPFYGIKFELQEMSDKDRSLDFTNPVTGEKSKVYDNSAKYRLKTESHTGPNGETVILPVMWVYDGYGDGSGTRWGAMDESDNPEKWISAKDWYDLEHPKSSEVEPRLIPVALNSFNYGGGNTQTKMFKQYHEFNVVNYGFQFYTTETPQTVRDFLITFCKNSYPDVREWAQYVIPTNISWQKVKDLATIK